MNYTWDANGNLLSDGVNTYTYDTAHRLVNVSAGASTTTYAYSGTGDRLGQTVNGTPTNYTLDLNAGLTQVLADGTNTYLYGNGRLGEQQPGGFVYHLPDALGSVRQLATAAGAPSLSQTFRPFGERMTSGGSGASSYGFTGEWQQGGLVYLRARYYASEQGRFTTRDPWPGDTSRPHSFNAWSYALSNPVTYADPSGHDPWWDEGDVPCWNGQSDTIYRYCILYRGGFLDAVHFKGARAYANINDPLSIWGSVYNARNKAEKHYVRYRTGIVNRVVFQQYYVVERLNEISDLQRLKGVALGIYLNSQFLYEALPVPTSAYSNEDLPSDYLGFLAGLEERDFEWVIRELGGGYASTDKPDGYTPTAIQFVNCYFGGDCDEFNPMNIQWTLRIKVNCWDGTTRFRNIPYPPSLTLEPTLPGRHWHRIPPEEYDTLPPELFQP